MPYTDTETKVDAFLKRKPRTRKQIQDHFGFTQSWTNEIISRMRSKLFIIRYEIPESKGRHAPVYALKQTGEEQDAVLEKKKRIWIPPTTRTLGEKAQRDLNRRLQLQAARSEVRRQQLLEKFRKEDEERKRAIKDRKNSYVRLYKQVSRKYGRKENWPIYLVERLRKLMAGPEKVIVKEDVVHKVPTPFDILKSYSANQSSFRQKKTA